MTAFNNRELHVGGKYISKNGDKWECIAIKGGTAWLTGDYGDGSHGSAYTFKLDGTPKCLEAEAGEYQIIFPPIIERKTVIASVDYKDGVPDWSTAYALE